MYGVLKGEGGDWGFPHTGGGSDGINYATAIAKLVSDEIWLQRNMEDHLLDKVERVNNIVVEFKGNMTISRTD